MRPSPPTLDGATVLRVADLGRATPTGATRHVVHGEATTEFAALAICRYAAAREVYLFYCDADWNVVTDTFHDTMDDAVAQAEFEFGSVPFVDVEGAG